MVLLDIPLDNAERIIKKMNAPDAADILTENEKEAWINLPAGEKAAALTDFCTRPIIGRPYPMYNWFFKTRWLEAFNAINLSAPASVVEIASGATDMIPKLLSNSFLHPETEYATVNLNKDLTSHFRERIACLPIKIKIVEDAAQKIEDHFGFGKIDAIVFEHSFNDIVETMIAEKNGIDTINTLWGDILPEMIRVTNEAFSSGAYEKIIRDEFMKMLRSLIKILKPGSFIVSHQFQYQSDLDLGILPEIWNGLISTIRKWAAEENIGREVFFDGFEPNWWMFLQKN